LAILLGSVAPIFGILLLGFLARKIGALKTEGVEGLVAFVFNFAVPVLLFRSLAQAELPDEIPFGFLAAFYGGSFGTYGLGMAVGRIVFRRPVDELAIFGMSSGFANTVMLGIPIVLTNFGEDASLPLFLIIAFHGAIFFPLTTIIIRLGRDMQVSVTRQIRSAASELGGNPIIVGIILGLLMNLAGIGLPGPLDTTASMLGAAAVPCALFAMGASLAGYPLMGEITPAFWLVPLKLVGHPFLAWLIAVPILGLEGMWVAVVVTLASMPTGVMPYMFAARYDAAPGVAARSVFLSTLSSVVTISVVLFLLRAG
jgi:predicted permease